jgi:hypothetical protein
MTHQKNKSLHIRMNALLKKQVEDCLLPGETLSGVTRDLILSWVEKRNPVTVKQNKMIPDAIKTSHASKLEHTVSDRIHAVKDSEQNEKRVVAITGDKVANLSLEMTSVGSKRSDDALEASPPNENTQNKTNWTDF